MFCVYGLRSLRRRITNVVSCNQSYYVTDVPEKKTAAFFPKDVALLERGEPSCAHNGPYTSGTQYDLSHAHAY